jgi:hypothetical protein
MYNCPSCTHINVFDDPSASLEQLIAQGDCCAACGSPSFDIHRAEYISDVVPTVRHEILCATCATCAIDARERFAALRGNVAKALEEQKRREYFASLEVDYDHL